MGVYRYWLENPQAMADLRAKYKILDDVLVRLDNPEDPIDGSVFHNGWMSFWLVTMIEGGVRFPLHPLLNACLREWNLCPCQLMPNGFKIIRGVVELNRILRINLGVHDIEDVYDLCKSGDVYYLRVRARRTGFVTALEDSNRYAGDDCLFVSGEWEFDESEPVASRVVRIPRRLETPPSKD